MTQFSAFEILVLCLAGLIALFLVLVVLVNYLPKSPLRDVLGAVTKRIGATAAVAMIAIPVQPIVGVDKSMILSVPCFCSAIGSFLSKIFIKHSHEASRYAVPLFSIERLIREK